MYSVLVQHDGVVHMPGTGTLPGIPGYEYVLLWLITLVDQSEPPVHAESGALASGLPVGWTVPTDVGGPDPYLTPRGGGGAS